MTRVNWCFTDQSTQKAARQQWCFVDQSASGVTQRAAQQEQEKCVQNAVSHSPDLRFPALQRVRASGIPKTAAVSRTGPLFPKAPELPKDTYGPNDKHGRKALQQALNRVRGAGCNSTWCTK
jgi:hypothetical protein